jgi:hypothetical protein
MTRRIFVDTEWTAVPWSPAADLLWIGLADEQGRTWCALSSDAEVTTPNEKYVSDLLRIITPDVPRLSRAEISTAVQTFCGDVDEFWAWIPTPASFAQWSTLGDDAMDVFQRIREIDLQMLRSVVAPWPMTWPNSIQDLNAAATAAAVEVPPRAPNHLHPRVHADWNQRLHALINRSHGTSDA